MLYRFNNITIKLINSLIPPHPYYFISPVLKA